MTKVEAISPPMLERVTSGVPGLDTILRGGFMRGGIYIVQGAPGAGKTILTNQMCFHHIRGEGRCALYVTLLAENHARMMQHLRGVAFFDQALVPDKLTYLSAFRDILEGGLKALTNLARREIQRRRCSMLVIDGLVSARATADTELAFKEFIHDLQEIALATDCTMFLTTNMPQREYDSTPEQTMVDGLIELNDRIYGWRAESDLQVRKFRGSGFLRGRHAYKITDSGFIVHPRIEALLAHPSREDLRWHGADVERRRQTRQHARRRTAGGLDHHGHGPLRCGQDDTRSSFPGALKRGRAGPDVRLLRDARTPQRQDRPDLQTSARAHRQRCRRGAVAAANRRHARCLRRTAA